MYYGSSIPADDGDLKEFLSFEERYKDDMIGICKPGTERERTRKLHRYGRTFAQMKKDGRIKSCNPAEMTERDVRAFIAEVRDRDGLETSTQERALALLHQYFESANNGYAVKMARKKLRITVPHKEIEVLSKEQVAIVEAVLENLSGWRMTVLTGVVAIALATGIRPGEIIRLSKKDVDLVNETVLVRFPKGNGKYQDPHLVGILRKDLVAKIDRYIAARDLHVIRAGADTDVLFPNLRNPRTFLFSDNALRQSMRKLSAICGFEFSTKTFRATFCTMVLDENYDLLPSVSYQMGHSNVETTIRYYNACKMARSRIKTQIVYSSIRRPDMKVEAVERIRVARSKGLLRHRER